MVSLSWREFEAARPLLDLLPDPCLLTGPDYAIAWRNQKAKEHYGTGTGTCHEMTHGRKVPCDQDGEVCPMHAAIGGQVASSVLHSHQSKTRGRHFYRVLAIPVEGGRVLEIHHELGDGLFRDELTGLYRRQQWFEIAGRDQSLLRRLQQPYALVFLDLDEFKRFNDTFGHLAGDELLRQLGAALTRELRASDTPCRWGGEEFVLFLPSTTQPQALQLAERIRAAVRSLRVQTATGSQRITASLGVFAGPPSVSLDDALQSADIALFAAKRAGRDRVVGFSERNTQGPATARTTV